MNAVKYNIDCSAGISKVHHKSQFKLTKETPHPNFGTIEKIIWQQLSDYNGARLNLIEAKWHIYASVV